MMLQSSNTIYPSCFEATTHDTCLCTGVMFTEARGSVAANPFLCGVKGNTVGMCSPAGPMEAYAILSYTVALCQCVLSYLLWGQLR